MKHHIKSFAAVVLVCSASMSLADPTQPLTLVGWGLDAKNLDTFIAQAAEVGFNVLITGSTDPAFLLRAVEAGRPHGIEIFSHISPMGRLGNIWKKEHPERPIPWQVMSQEEETAFQFITAGRNRYIIPYQWGGEPIMTHEVLVNRILCMSSEEARDLLTPLIDNILSVAGIGGLAFDGFGYQNYRRCYCEQCERRLTEFRQRHPDLPADQAGVVFFRTVLVDYINHLADYARSKQNAIKTSIHIWPVFEPEPLYGNRLDIDFCGQTAAWYILWPKEKIADYSRRIMTEATKYHPRQQGVGMIGYYDRPGEFPVKDAARVEMELKTMIDNGCRRIQVCSTVHVLKNEAVAAVFRRYFTGR